MYTKKIINMISAVKGNESLVGALDDSSSIVDDVNFDSLELVRFMLMIEEELHIEVDYELFDFKHLSTIASFNKFICNTKESSETLCEG